MRSTLKWSGSAFAAALSLALLSACGGGGGESVADPGTGHPPGGEGKDGPAVVALVCPENYRGITVDAVQPSATYTLESGDARFEFTLPSGHVSAKFCFGTTPAALNQEGYVRLSDTYEVLMQSPAPYAEKGDPTVHMSQLPRELSIAFPRSLLPEGTTNEQMIEKVRIYSPDASGVWQPQPGGVVTPAADSADPELPLNFVTAAPNDSGRFVVAFKP